VLEGKEGSDTSKSRSQGQSGNIKVPTQIVRLGQLDIQSDMGTQEYSKRLFFFAIWDSLAEEGVKKEGFGGVVGRG